MPLRIGLALVLLEAIVLVVLGIAVVAASILDHGDLLGTNAGVLLVLVLIGGFLVLAVRGLWQGKRWGRAPVITWQLLQFAVAVTSWGALEWWALVPALVLDRKSTRLNSSHVAISYAVFCTQQKTDHAYEV